MNNELLEIVNQTTILGLILTNDLTWRKNTDHLVKKANFRMIILRNLIEFPVPIKNLVLIYSQFIRVILEFNSNVWFSSITKEESSDLERVQRNACKLILQNEYVGYQIALEKLNLESLEDRRNRLAKKFAQGCQNLEEMKDLFVQNTNQYNIRQQNTYNVKFASKPRLLNSTVPTLQRMLNSNK